ncbi:hypothetical protein CERZMDRAFT_100013 [Cercospora zeae-maydis SCOH1-5]|uniref:Uncharacterized protein n=1 Tax=Cercospora zeae-maydis SCOH1-5 TaxID=717836 RepID=A0A6A6F995_9PEZI|nr:hypothetical protein CERZMDRAFT_100013 [Cercospora zeae-maydis SCOH1-5]
MSPASASIKASSLYSEAKMVDCTRVKFDVPIGTWGQTQVEVEYPWHRDLDSIILPLLETAHEQQAERQRKHRSDGSMHKSHSKKSQRSSAKTERNDSAVLPMRPNQDIKLYLKGFESARDLTTKRGETFQTVLEQYAKQTEKDVERLELFHKGKHAGRNMTPDTVSRTVRNCKSMSSLSSSATSTQSRELRRRNKDQSEQPVEEPERGSILVGNDISGESTRSLRSPWYIAPMVPEKNPLRNMHHRNASWTSISSNTSGKALKMLGIDTNELQHHLAHIDSVVPLQHYTSGSVTRIDLHPGPSRVPRQYAGSISVQSKKAYEILGATVEETLKHLDLQTSSSDVNSIHDSLSPIESRRWGNDSQGRAVTISSTDKARRMLGVDRPDSDSGPGGRQRTVHDDYTFRTRSYPSAKPVNYPTTTSSSAYPDPLNHKHLPLKSGTRRPDDLASGAHGDEQLEKQKSDPTTTSEWKTDPVIVPFAEDANRASDDIKLTTTCSGPGGTQATDQEMVPEHAIQFKFRGTVAKRCPRMSGIIENCNLRRSWSA